MDDRGDMAGLPGRGERRAWVLACVGLNLFPLFLALADLREFGLAFRRGGVTFALFLALEALLILGGARTYSLWWADAAFGRATRWRRVPARVGFLALGGALWSAFAMFALEISGLAGRMLLMRLSILVGLVVWFALLLRMADFSPRRLGRAVTYGIVQLIFFVIVEMAVSLIFPQGYATRTVWFVPGALADWRQYVGWGGVANGAALAFSPGEFTTIVRTNAHGLRDDPASYEKPPGLFRVLALGDSYTWAQEVMLEDTYHVRLEALLSTAASPVEVVAAGYGGWGTDQELQYLVHEGCRYQPDLVLLQTTANDLLNNYRPFESAFWGGDRKPYYELDEAGALVLRNSPFVDRQADGSVLVGLRGHLEVISRAFLVLSEILAGYQAPVDLLATADARRAPEHLLPFFIPEGRWPEQERAYALMDALLRELQREAENCGAPLAIFIVPRLHYAEERYVMPAYFASAYPEWAGYAWDYLLPAARVTALAADAGIPVMPYERLVSLYDDYHAGHGTLIGLTWRWVGHFTPYGHERLARALADWLQAEALVPAP